MVNYGYIASKIDGTESIIDNMPEYQSLDIPKEYSYAKYMPLVKDQGNTFKCVPYSISSIVEWKHIVSGDKKYNFSIDYIFENRENKSLNGMSIKEALNKMKKHGYVSDKEYSANIAPHNKIDFYGRLVSYIFMQRSLVANGPFVMALPVYNSMANDFWNGQKLEGGHAVCCVGYNNEGLIILNSWGFSYGNRGYWILPYKDIDKIYEAWAII